MRSWWRLATGPSGASTGERARMRPEWYGCRRTSSQSSGRSGPGRSQMPVGTATRPRSWTRPARYASPASAPSTAALAARASPATPREWPCEPRRLQVGGVAEAGERLVERGVVVERAPRRRLGVDDRGPEVVGGRDAQQLARRVEEDRRDRRVERAPRPAGDRLRRERLAAEGVEHDARVADGGEPRRLGDLVARRAPRARRGRRSARSRRARPGAPARAAAGAPSAPPRPRSRRARPRR